MFAKILSILRRKKEVHGIRWHFQTTTKGLRNICNKWAKNHVTSYKILVLCCLCILHVNYLEIVTRISQTTTISNKINLKAQSLLHDLQYHLQKKNPSKQTKFFVSTRTKRMQYQYKIWFWRRIIYAKQFHQVCTEFEFMVSLWIKRSKKFERKISKVRKI